MREATREGPSRSGNRHGPSRRMFLAGAGIALAGCAGGNRAPPSMKLHMRVEVDDLVNLNERGDPSPIVVRIYELRSNSQFEQAAFFDLLDNDSQRLGTDIVGKRELELKPGDKLEFLREAGLDARFVGVIAGYRELAKAEWRSIAEIIPEFENAMFVRVSPLSIRIQRTNTFRSSPITVSF